MPGESDDSNSTDDEEEEEEEVHEVDIKALEEKLRSSKYFM
jgi:hypothetical protein